jgi:hypothetical protein
MKRVLIWIAIGFGALVVVVAFIPNDSAADLRRQDEKEIANNKWMNEQSRAITAKRIVETALPRFSAAQYAADYEANEVAADNKYKGKKFLVSGSVKSINKDILGNANLALSTPDAFIGVIASLDDKDYPWASTLKRGQKVSLLCTGSGMLLTPMLTDCRNSDTILY